MLCKCRVGSGPEAESSEDYRGPPLWPSSAAQGHPWAMAGSRGFQPRFLYNMQASSLAPFGKIRCQTYHKDSKPTLTIFSFSPRKLYEEFTSIWETSVANQSQHCASFRHHTPTQTRGLCRADQRTGTTPNSGVGLLHLAYKIPHAPHLRGSCTSPPSDIKPERPKASHQRQ